MAKSLFIKYSVANALAIQKVTFSVVTFATLGLNNTQRNDPDVVSLTSFGERINTVHHTIISLLNQSERPDKLILCSAEHEFMKPSLPS